MKSIRNIVGAMAFAVTMWEVSTSAVLTPNVVTNLNNTATTFGLTPSVALNQGSAAGIADGTMWAWAHGASASPRIYASPAQNLQPWMTWATDQEIRMVRVWEDDEIAGHAYDRLRLDVLVGTLDPTIEGNWSNVYDSGTGQFIKFRDIDLGATYTMRGLRIRADITASTDINVGEVAVFNELPKGGTLTTRRVFPSSIAGSSTGFSLGPNGANDAIWFTRWIGDTPASNPGSDYTYDLNFNNATLDTLSLTFANQGGVSAIPSSWELLMDTGTGLSSLGTFNATTAQNGQTRGQYYISLGSRVSGVSHIQLRVPEANLAGGLALSLVEFEAFNVIPEPSMAVLLALGGLVLWRRHR